ncbi:MAG: zinc ribbon domain-containing protein [Bacilli bacterium]|nr:zinc ribbon domain-containing protein [Bacilli bacterium]
MNCRNCGYLLSNEDQFCKNCGAPVAGEQAPAVSSFKTVETESETPNVSQQGFQQPMQMQQPAMSQQQMSASQPFMSGQQSYNGNQMNPFNSQFPKNDNSKFIILGILVTVIVAIIGIVIVLVFKKDGGNNVDPNSGTNIQATPTTDKKSYDVTVGDFTFSVPEDLVTDEGYEDGSEYLLIGDKDETWVSKVVVLEGSYDILKANKDVLQSELISKGYSVAPVKVASYAGYEMITFEVQFNGVNQIGGYAKANSNYTFVFELLTADNSANYKLLDVLAPVFKSAKYKANTSNMEINSGINFKEAFEALK